ncbi:L-carnitine dehydratase/bile acid-inducible protein F [Pseudonocardia sp. Ae168_Ps1]|uniref:CaiB/BaiF CoA transferase family protein n=1 Tax=unclassified Pseudonocardia TaxID=2619320 RepID=UPI0001FFE1D3|nr:MULTISPECIES: CoA transferase [unclassified Pseudonocardia]ALE73064.1 CoA-transferase [Pseudonocardia sp. EC080625-04]ALL76378.1 CoA-transferase [Pseudonocardia sp. EC080610-09]ALL83405.1 CoA-transferase [Pseudonocardia sp. EC080619-01]OLL72791.1 L-carnitine dehydratase/bile acid-inducible protein F [Pseudonocardia sp. Ae150A_Ps1]OLL78765.1 L-carnitine dehydratase/bile acid-inducible protein F [Pseudonocardia sp. Ae168_Ps1]
MSDLPLSGIRVLELGNYIAAPTTGRLLADFGADVIKVERPRTGDELRNWRLYAGDTSMLYRTLNRNKRSITLDLRSDAGRRAVLDLAASCDVVLENFRPGTLEKWGLGPGELDAANPDVVLVRISAFGQTGPMSARPGFAAVAEAMGGLRALVGEEDRPPSRTGVSIGDSIAGLYGAFSAVMGLYQREAATDRPPLDRRSMDVALNEAVFSMMESLVPDHLAYGVERRRVGGRMEGIAPSNAYECGDGGSVVIAGNGDSIYGRFMQVIGRPELADQPDLASNAGRWERRDELDAAIEAWTRSMPRDEVLARLESAGVPAGPIYSAPDIVGDAQFRARNMVQYFDVDTGGPEPARVGFPGVVPVLGGESVPVRHVGPDLGADTGDVLGGLLGYTDDAVRAASGEES